MPLDNTKTLNLFSNKYLSILIISGFINGSPPVKPISFVPKSFSFISVIYFLTSNILIYCKFLLVGDDSM